MPVVSAGGIGAPRKATSFGVTCNPEGKKMAVFHKAASRTWNLFASGGLVLCLCFGLQGFSAASASAALKQGELVSVKIQRLTIDPESGQPVVILSDEQENLGLSIWIGFFEAHAMNAEIQGLTHPRPLTHDLLENVIQKARLKIHRVIITHLEKSTYHATMILEIDGTLVPIDARPSDSMIMALKFDVPLFVSRGLFQRSAVLLQGPKSIENTYGLTAQDLTPALAEAFLFSSAHGVLISHVEGKSRAARDGLKQGDIVFEMENHPIANLQSLRDRLRGMEKPSTLRVHRQGKALDLIILPKP